MGLLDGDTALITGAASGIGRGIAKALVAEGVRPVLSDVAVEAGRALAREMNATFIPADLADPTAPRKLFDCAPVLSSAKQQGRKCRRAKSKGECYLSRHCTPTRRATYRITARQKPAKR